MNLFTGQILKAVMLPKL